MKIDLREYATELRYWLEAFKPFVDKVSHPSLMRLQEEIENGRDNLRPSFGWKLAAPIQLIDADRYDGTVKSPHVVRVTWQFEAEFKSRPDSRKTFLWTVENMVTHVRVYSAKNDEEILHFHHDMKNKGQLGPHSHMQFSEHYQKDKGKIPIAVPRFPTVAMLPTDCLDFVLAEFFPFEWPKSQSTLVGLAALQKRQRDRMMRISHAIASGWTGSRMTPIAAVQNCYEPDLQIA